MAIFLWALLSIKHHIVVYNRGKSPRFLSIEVPSVNLAVHGASLCEYQYCSFSSFRAEKCWTLTTIEKVVKYIQPFSLKTYFRTAYASLVK